MAELGLRARMGAAVQEALRDPSGPPDGSVVVGFVVVAEVMTPSGGRQLAYLHGDAFGEALPVWQARGYLHDALFHPEEYEDDDDDEGGG